MQVSLNSLNVVFCGFLSSSLFKNEAEKLSFLVFATDLNGSELGLFMLHKDAITCQ